MNWFRIQFLTAEQGADFGIHENFNLASESMLGIWTIIFFWKLIRIHIYYLGKSVMRPFLGARPSAEASGPQESAKKCTISKMWQFFLFSKILGSDLETSKRGIGSRVEWNADQCLAFVSLLLSGAAVESGTVVTNALKIFGRKTQMISTFCRKPRISVATLG
jgi:hypothetical protein